ncbi:DUF2179 domain-containing protein [Candidatus Formimonas warabiya]|uniref:UPF0316 protein DCMF_17175 n=1 Tax=Formimonas warabiya TaxID=1761012 RepID=A0A3G1KUV4_FORW1|nr:DUF2179 domain-containing protein [Candidatus Formimonas warabiya]ATW26258.1 hypothetical protein DCMF_17175 [Candidatus Formimonas warabiya]
MKILLTILGIQIVFVSLFTMRMIFTLKNRTYLASLISMVEVFVYVLGLNLVLKSLDNPAHLAVYCVGYALGILVGSKIEEKMALGHVVVQIIAQREDIHIADTLRQSGYGVTTWYAEGRDTSRLVMEVLTKRKYESRLFKLVETLNSNILIISQEPRNFRGGFRVSSTKDHSFAAPVKKAA